jgi:hypothetical protein
MKRAYVDLTGQKFGNLTVIERTQQRKGTSIVWLCICKCGSEKKVSSTNLRNESTKGCGKYECRPNFNDLSGQKFGKLTVLKFSHVAGWGAYWDCSCSCGNFVNLMTEVLTAGNTQSCGCGRRDGQYDSIKKRAYRQHLRGAKNRGIESFLSQKEYLLIASQQCHYCGDLDFKTNASTGAKIRLNGVDRKDNEKFYKLINSIPCCGACNAMKMATPYDEFMFKIDKIYNVKKSREDSL